MKKRVSVRLKTHLDAKLFCANKLWSGTIKNISDKDMYIESEMCYPVHTEFQVLIPTMKGIIIVPVAIRRIQVGTSHLAGMGLQLKQWNDNYLNLVNSHKPTLSYSSIN